MERPLTLSVLANACSSNVGNGALLEGTLRVLEEDLGRELKKTVLPWDEYSFQRKTFDDEFIDTVNASELFAVIGAVTFNGRPYYDQAGMRFDLSPAQMDKIRRPVVLYGLSYRHWNRETYHHLDKLQAALRYIDERPDFLLGLRDDGTQPWLEGLIGFPLEQAVTIPDPAMFVPHGDGHAAPRKGKEIFISLNNEDAPRRFQEPGARDRLLDAVAAAIVHAVEKWDAQITIVNHYFDDLALIEPLMNRLPPWLAHMRIKSLGPAHIDDTEEFYARYVSADALISMRVHSMTPAVGMQIPLIVLSSQDRIQNFVRNFGLEEQNLATDDPALAEKLPHALDLLLENPEPLREHLRSEAQSRRERLKVFNGQVEALLR